MTSELRSQNQFIGTGEAPETFGILPHNNPNPVMEVDSGGQLIHANEVAYKLATVNNLASPIQLLPQEYLSHVASSIEGRKSILRLESEIGSFTYAWALVPDKTKNIAYFYGADITAYKAAEKSVRKQEIQLLHAQKMDAIGNLAAGIAHDFNNFIGIIRGFADLTLMNLNDHEEISHNQEVIIETAASATKLVRQLLTFSSEQPNELVLLDINESVTAMERMLQSLVGSDVKIVSELCQNCDPIKADRAKIDQIILNLVVNAKDAMPDGGKITIRSRSQSNTSSDYGVCGKLTADKYMELSIIDEGTGMDEETKMRIFEPFFTTKQANNGTGLGLSTVYSIVKSFGGNILVDSAPGKGTTITVLLPLSGENN